MPWQAEVALVAGEMIVDEETGILVPAYPEVFVTVPRQSGKTTLNLSWSLDRAILWEAWDRKPQAIAYTAQSGSEARKKFRYEHVPLIKRSELWPHVRRDRYAAEDTGLTFKNGANLTIGSTSEDAGHGSTVDLAILDEIFSDTDYRREQAFGPAMATRHDFQMVLSSTAGDEKSTVYNAKRLAGRAAVTAGARTGMAYWEYSASDDDDPADRAVWRRIHPALGFTITERTIQAAWERADRAPADKREAAIAEFTRGWLNIPHRRKGAERVISEPLWAKVTAAHPTTNEFAAPDGKVVLAADGQPDQASGSIAVADTDLRGELIENRTGTAWMLAELVRLSRRWADAPVVIDVGGPVGFLADQLEEADVPVIRFGTADVAHACAAFMDRLVDGALWIRPHSALSDAVPVAIRQRMGDRWKWARVTVEVDISPLVALTFAYGHVLAGGLNHETELFVAFS